MSRPDYPTEPPSPTAIHCTWNWTQLDLRTRASQTQRVRFTLWVDPDRSSTTYDWPDGTHFETLSVIQTVPVEHTDPLQYADGYQQYTTIFRPGGLALLCVLEPDSQIPYPETFELTSAIQISYPFSIRSYFIQHVDYWA